jgi:hypothetical protein
MKTFSFSPARITALGLAVAFAVAISAQASTTEKNTTVPAAGKKKAGAAVPAVPNGGGEVGLLDQAYGLLSHADHDYKGHRMHAMHAIEAAAKELGQTLGGHGKGDEKQTASDSQLRNAQSLLEQAVSGLTGKPHRHVEEAIKQLSVALSVK